MKITFLGTAANHIPLGFCNCNNCSLVRKTQGKSIRKSASILVDDDLIIDLGPDIHSSLSMYDKKATKIKYALQTHCHIDHFDTRAILGLIFGEPENVINIIASEVSLKIIKRGFQRNINNLANTENLKLLCINSGQSISVGKYCIKAITSTHCNDCLLYVINYKDKNIFYATDTALFNEEVFEQLEDIKIDLLILDHTFKFKNGYHLNNKSFDITINELLNRHIIDEKTKIYATHLSHDEFSIHEDDEIEINKNGYCLAYDGLELII